MPFAPATGGGGASGGAGGPGAGGSGASAVGVGEKRARSLAASSPFVTLYSSWRSSSSYRVRIGLNWKRIQYTCRSEHARR